MVGSVSVSACEDHQPRHRAARKGTRHQRVLAISPERMAVRCMAPWVGGIFLLRQADARRRRHVDDLPASMARAVAPSGCSSMVEQKPSKLTTRVRFPSPAPISACRGEAANWSARAQRAATRMSGGPGGRLERRSGSDGRPATTCRGPVDKLERARAASGDNSSCSPALTRTERAATWRACPHLERWPSG